MTTSPLRIDYQTPEKSSLDTVAQIRLAAISKHHCTGIGLVTQLVGPIKDFITKEGSGEGICMALSWWWLKAQKADKPLLGQLLGVGGSINHELLAKITAEHKTVSKKEDAYIKTLGQNGLTYREKKVHVARNKKALGDKLIAANESLCILYTEGGLAHAMALDLRRPCMFFDPNVGEFKFATLENLAGFLNQIFPINDDPNVPYWQYMNRERLPATGENGNTFDLKKFTNAVQYSFS